MIRELQKDEEMWGLFTRKEEYTSDAQDLYERFPFYATKYREILEPRVSQYLIRHGLSPEYPDNRPFAVCLTHDIDDVYQAAYLKCFQAVIALKNRQFGEGVRKAAWMRSKCIPWWNFREIMALEEEYSAHSTFYFLAQDRGHLDYTYTIEDLEHEIGTIVDQGWEVGLHGGHTAYNNLDTLIGERKRLEAIVKRRVVGYRSHYLRFRVPDTWRYLSEAGFVYDTTLGYPECAGFRNGMCHPFRPFDLQNQREIDIWELPLVAMDRTFDVYMKLGPDCTWRMLRQLIDATERSRGVVTILWHNTSWSSEQLFLYRKILDYCSKKQAWLASCSEVIEWWQKNVSMK
jgi:peptidoglycan/xylan/chitin deacetylase (PgdA/CDA1 family)